MRPGQNKRMRGRNNNNNGGHRRGPNPLTRSYESNGPDVKIRGTAQHIGEKYLQLARDAQTSGDPVAAENYLQHAEHYFRIIAAAQQAQQQAQFGYQRAPGEADAEEVEGEDDVVMPDRFSLPSERFAQQNERLQPPNGTGQPSQNGTGQQPPYPAQNGFDRPDRGQPGEGYRAERDQRPEREPRPEREYRPDREQRPDYRPNTEFRQGGERQTWDRQGGDRGGNQDRDRPYRNDRNQQQQRGPRYPRENGDPRDQRGEREPQPRDYRDPRDPATQDARQRPEPAPEANVPESGTELPAFITAPVRAPSPGIPPSSERIAESAPAFVPTDEAAVSSDTVGGPSALDAESFPTKPRRRRRTRAAIEAESAGVPSEPSDDATE